MYDEGIPRAEACLLTEGRAEEKHEELGNLEIVLPQHEWHKHEIASILHKLNDGISSQARLVLE